MLKINFGKARQSIDKMLENTTRALVELENRREPLKKLHDRQAERWAINVTSGGRLYGSWEPLAPITIENRLALGFGPGPILQRRGRLVSYVIAKSKQGKIDNQAVFWKFQWTGRRDASVAALHSEGYAYTPARKIWDLNKADENAAEREFDRWVNTIVSKYYS